MTLCSVDGCENKHVARGFCGNHYALKRRHKEFITRKPVSSDERFMSRVKIDKKTNAWIWTGGVTAVGYGAFWFDGETIGAHRYAYMMKFGAIPKGMVICHKYEELGRHNVNPDHLFLGTPRDNNVDMANKDRTAYGIQNGANVLSEKAVADIRLSSETCEILSIKHSVSIATISRVRRGITWRREKNFVEATSLSLRNKTGYRGVRLNKGKYEAALTSKKLGKTFYLGRFDEAIDAAKAYDKKAIEYFGVDAKLNFPS